MSAQIGSLVFDSWRSLPLGVYAWSDTFVFPMSAQDGLPPSDYARLVSSLARPIARLRRSASLWVPVHTPPGNWFMAELRRALRGTLLPVAVTAGDLQLPRASDFTFMPWTDCLPSPPPPVASDLFTGDHSSAELGCLRVLARVESACTAEIASLAGISIPSSRRALIALREDKLISLIHGKYPYWQIRRPGLSMALRSWGVPRGIAFSARKERRMAGESSSPNGRHRRTARLWPAWLHRAWPQAEIWASWSEVAMGRLHPDALAWGRLDGQETLFWLEVEGGHASRAELQRRARVRCNRAILYARSFSINLVFVILAQGWIRETIVGGFCDLPDTVSVVLADWISFGWLPAPAWGRAVNG